MKGRQLTASNLRIILSATLLLIAGAGVALFVYFHSVLDTYAQDVQKIAADAEASDSKLTRLANLKVELDKQREVITRAKSIVAQKLSYDYQDQVVTDIERFASRNSITVNNFDFTSVSPAVSDTSRTTAPISSGIEGAKPTTVRVEIQNPSTYPKIINFIYDIEQNLTKMQISRVELRRQPDKDNAQGITCSAFEIEVYIKEKVKS